MPYDLTIARLTQNMHSPEVFVASQESPVPHEARTSHGHGDAISAEQKQISFIHAQVEGAIHHRC